MGGDGDEGKGFLVACIGESEQHHHESEDAFGDEIAVVDQGRILLSVAWTVAILLAFVPLGIRRYRAIDR